MNDPYRPTDDDARALARQIIEDATYAALSVLQPDTGHPTVSRIAVATDAQGSPISLISTLSDHTRALTVDRRCALLLGAPQDKGDPLTHPRLTLHCVATILPHDADATVRARYLSMRPKAKLYAGFTDFHLVTFAVTDALLNGGFGKAYRLMPHDL